MKRSEIILIASLLAGACAGVVFYDGTESLKPPVPDAGVPFFDYYAPPAGTYIQPVHPTVHYGCNFCQYPCIISSDPPSSDHIPSEAEVSIEASRATE